MDIEIGLHLDFWPAGGFAIGVCCWCCFGTARVSVAASAFFFFLGASCISPAVVAGAILTTSPPPSAVVIVFSNIRWRGLLLLLEIE